MKVRGEINPEDLDAFLDNVLDPPPKKTFPFSMYYTEGVKYHHSRQYDLALKNYEAALQIDPASVKTLLKRSKVYIELQEYSKARKDAIAAFKLASSSSFSEACDLKGRCEYYMGDFERGFLTFFRGKRLNLGSEKLRLGQQLCEKAMWNAMLEPSEDNIDGRDLKLLLVRKNRDCSKNRSRYSEDKRLFEGLLEDGDLKSVHSICSDGLEFIEKSEKFWRMQKPHHNRKKASLKRKQIAKRDESVQHAVSVIRRCMNYLQNEMASHCVSEALKLMQFFESHPESLSDDNIKFKADVLHLLGLAYEMLMRDRLSLSYFEKELKVAQTHNIVHLEMRAFHHLGRRYFVKGKMKKACHCLLGIRDVLNSERMKNYFNDSEFDDVENGAAKGGRNTELAEVHAARVWAQNFKSELKSVIQDTIIAPEDYLLLDIYEEEMRTMDTDIVLRYLFDSESDDIENYLKFSYFKQ